MKWGKSLVTGLVALLLISVMLGNVSGVIASTTPSISQLALPEYDPSPPANSDQIRRAYHSETGKLSFLGIGPGAQPSAQFQFASNASVQDQANAALAAFGDQFGINDPGSELRRMEIQQGSGVLNTVKYQQVFQGVPILAGELIVNMQSSGRLSSISGEISPGLSISTTPGISPEEAADIARSAMAMYYKVDPASFNSSQPELWIFDERLLLPSSWPAELVWRMDVEGNAQLPIRELVLVNAQTGGISLHFNQIDTFWTELGMSNREDSSIQPIPESLPSNSLRPADEWRTFHYDALAFESRAVQHLSIDVSTTQETAPAFLPGTSWYVATGGNDANDCLNSLSACLTIDAALAKPTFTPGDSILVQEGVYTGSGDQVVLIDKDVTLSGGWDSDFQSQTGRSILDGERTRRVVKTEPLTSVVMDRFHVRNGFVMYDLGGGIASYGDLDLRNSTIRGNRAARGGGLSIDENTASSLFNVEILDNFSEGRGGAIYTDGQLLIVDSVIHNNVATSDGGGIYKNGGSLELEASEVFENKTEQHGGGIYLSHGDQFFIRTSIYSNQAGSGGGGIYQYNGLSILTNSTISGNSTGNEGGGANVYKGSLGLYSSTMVRNSSGEGGGIFTDTGDAFAVLSNSILAENSSGVGPDCSGDQISSNGYSLIGDSTSCPYTPGPGDLVGVDPGLGDMINIPGHFPLRPGSPAIDAGNPLGCEDHLGAAIDADQRGAPRVGRCDIGAYEYAEPGAPSSIIFMGDQSRKFTPNVAAGEPIRALAVDEVNTPVPGVEILFRAPASGPSGTFQGSGTNEISLPTSQDGIAEAAQYIANNQLGDYVIEAVADGVAAELPATNFAWYVASSGSGSNTCLSPDQPCATTAEVLGRMSFERQDPILLRGETITGSESEVILVDQEAAIFGGWDPSFSTQDGVTVIDGQGARRGVTIAPYIDVGLDHFSIVNGSATQGGGIYAEGGLTLTNSMLTNNDALDGGALYGSRSPYDLSIFNCVVNGNSASDEGGGLYVSSRHVDIAGSTISGNSADLGGGMFNGSGLLLTETTIANNSAYDRGGGIYNIGGLQINQSTISGNDNGGGIDVYAGYLLLVNSTVSGNSQGPGIRFDIFYSGGKILNSTITGNHGQNRPGGLAFYGSGNKVAVGSSIIAGNLSYDSEPDCEGRPLSLGHNLIGSTDECEEFSINLFDLVGTLDDPIDPMLGTLTDNGGATQTHALLPGSPAIDTADPDGCVDEEGNLLDADQRGEDRPLGWACDMGAYEASPGGSFFPPVITYTADNYESRPGIFLCFRNDPTCTDGANPHADAAHTHAAQTYTYFKENHNRDSIDDAGKFLVSMVNFGVNYPNSYWDGSKMVYGDAYGYPLADDVVAHEITHGITQYSSSLLPYYQSGAINESFSDLWGEFVDLTNGTGDDGPYVKWLIGEDISGHGAVRAMYHPPRYNDPDKMTSSLYYVGSAEAGYWGDNGGIHTNSGVNNKAAFLMAEGGSFNGYTVLPLGIEKTSEIYYRVQTRLLTSGADYADLYQALNQACVTLIGVKGITEHDCLEVQKAVDAVEMNLDPEPGYNPEAEICSEGEYPDYLFLDDFEVDASKWSSYAEIGPNRWFYSSGYAASGSHMLWNDNYSGTSDEWVMMDLDVGLPTGQSYLRFNHAFGLQHPDYDGGWLEYSTDGGSTWVDAGTLHDSGQDYNGDINTYFGDGDNPYTGKSAFIADSHGYVSSRYDLSPVAGESIRFRWRMATDRQIADLGWFIDDVGIYECLPLGSKGTVYLPFVSR